MAAGQTPASGDAPFEPDIDKIGKESTTIVIVG